MVTKSSDIKNCFEEGYLEAKRVCTKYESTLTELDAHDSPASRETVEQKWGPTSQMTSSVAGSMVGNVLPLTALTYSLSMNNLVNLISGFMLAVSAAAINRDEGESVNAAFKGSVRHQRS